MRIEDSQEDEEASAEGCYSVRNPRSVKIIGYDLGCRRPGLVNLYVNCWVGL